MDEYHGIVIEQSLADRKLLEKSTILSKKEESGLWILYKISFQKGMVDEMIKIAQAGLKSGKWYVHFYMKENLIIVFKQMVFLVSSSDKKTWEPAVHYGKSAGIPERQLNFRPCRIEEETW